MQPTPSSPPPTNNPRKIKWKYIVPIIVALIVAVGGIISAIVTRPQPQTITPTPTTTPSVTATSTLPSATAVPISPTVPTWLVQPTAQFGAVVPDHEFKEPVYPEQILSLSTDVGQFTALDTNNNPMTVQLQPQAGKSYVIILMGDQTGSTPITLDVTSVSSGHIDWEIRTPPAGTQLLPASVTVEERVASGLMMKPNCGGNGCTTVGYYILDSGMHIRQTGEL